MFSKYSLLDVGTSLGSLALAVFFGFQSINFMVLWMMWGYIMNNHKMFHIALSLINFTFLVLSSIIYYQNFRLIIIILSLSGVLFDSSI